MLKTAAQLLRVSITVQLNSMKKEENSQPGEQKLPTTTPGNASNPPANGDSEEQNTQLLDAGAEKYLREGGNIEDMPDEDDWQNADDDSEGTEDSSS